MSESEYWILTDPGTSHNKEVAKNKRGRLTFAGRSPYCAKVTSQMAAMRMQSWGNNISIENAWIEDMDGVYFLGSSARKYIGSGISNTELKYHKALYKTLATIGNFAQTHGIPNGTFISVGLLLPFDEYLSKDKFIKNFSIAIEQFNYCGRQYGFPLEKLSIYPEGAGTILSGIPKTVKFKELRIGAIGFGQRNTTFLLYNQGFPDIEQSRTSNLGFRWLVEEVRKVLTFRGSDSSKLDEVELTKRIVDGTEVDVNAAVFEVEPIYYAQINEWLQECPGCDYYPIFGGTALKIGVDNLNQIPTLKGKIIWLGPLEEDQQDEVLHNDMIYKEILKYPGMNPWLAFRYIDAVGIVKRMA